MTQLQAVESDDEEGPDDEDLYAFTSLADSPNAASSSRQESPNQEGSSSTGQQESKPRQTGGFAGPTVFASMTLGMSHAMLRMNKAFEQMSMRAQHRRRLSRPT